MDPENGANVPAEPSQLFVVLNGFDEHRPEFANIIQVNHDPIHFQIAFARYLFPMGLRPDQIDDYRVKVASEGIGVDVVARLIVAPTIMKDMVAVLQSQIESYEQKFGPIPAFGGERPLDVEK